MAQAVDPDREDAGKHELTVAPDITVALSPPDGGTSEQRIRATPRRDDLLDTLRGARRDGRDRQAQPQAPSLPQPQPDADRLEADLARATLARDQAVRARDQAVRDRDRIATERDQAVRERDRVASERDQALRERQQAVRERDRAIARAEKVADDAATRYDRRPAAGHAPLPRSRSAPGGAAVWAQRVLAVSVLVIVVLALAITTRVI